MVATRSPGFDLDAALLDPAAWFRVPEDVLARTDLAPREKAEILCRWAYDVRALAVAEDEGMRGGEAMELSRVMQALRAVVDNTRAGRRIPTQHAGRCIL